MKRADVNPPPQPYQTVLLVPHDQAVLFVQPGQGGNVIPGAKVMCPINNSGVIPFPIQTTPTPSATYMPSGMPTLAQEPSLTQPHPVSFDSMPATPKSEQEDPKDPKEGTQGKSSGKIKSRGYLKSDSAFQKMSAEQKDALCKYVYEFMVQKEFTSQEGYLIVDVFSEVWKDMGDNGEGWRVAQQRFNYLLRSAPQYFRLFRRGIRVANQCGWFARKGEKMVRLVLENEK